MKRIITFIAAVAMALSVPAPAMAVKAPQTSRQEQYNRHFTFDEDIDSEINVEWTAVLSVYDVTSGLYSDSDRQHDSYCVFSDDSIFKVSNTAPRGGDDYVWVYAVIYAARPDGKYAVEGHRVYSTEGRFKGFTSANGGWTEHAMVFPGSTVTFTGADIIDGIASHKISPDNTIIELVIAHQYPESDYYWFHSVYLKRDNDFVAYLRTTEASAKPSRADIELPFTDVPRSKFYFMPVAWAVKRDVTNGTTPTTFSPDATCSIAHILTFLWRAYGCPEPKGENPFTNIKPSHYYYRAAIWAYEKNLIAGNYFNGSLPCTRSTTVTYMWKLAGEPGGGENPFRDVPNDAEYAKAVSWAVREGVTEGTTATTFSPDSTCTRGQIMTFLYRFLGDNK